MTYDNGNLKIRLGIHNNILIQKLNDNKKEFPKYLQLDNYILPSEIKISKFAPPSGIRIIVKGAGILDESPFIECELRGTGRYEDVSISELLEIKTDMFIHKNQVIRIKKSSMDKLEKILNFTKINDLTRISLRQYIDLVRSDDDGIIDYSSLNNVNLEKIKDLMMPIESSLFEGVPYDYQMEGVRWMWLLSKEELGLVLGDEMGLGKTFQIIFLFCLMKDRNNLPSLVVCPATLVSNWKREINKFAPKLKVYIHKGPKRTGSTEYLKKFDIIITSYDTLISSKGEMQYLFSPIFWGLVILDEAQAIKNPDAQRSIAVKNINSISRIAVTGTPLENRLSDTWSLFDFCLPGFLNDLEVFLDRYPNNKHSAEILEKTITPFILRRLIRDVKNDLPKLIKVEHAITMSQFEKEDYEKYINTITQGSGDLGFEHIQKLRVYCTHPNLTGSKMKDIEYSKFYTIIELLREVRARGQKAVIFTSFRGMINQFCESILEEFGSTNQILNPYIDYIDGRNSSNALEIIDKFSEKEGFAVLILNPKAAGTGLTITAANHVFHYNPEWNPALMAQATGRVHRIGQENIVIAHYMYCKDTIEEKVWNTLDFKRELFENAIKGVTGDSEDEEIIVNSVLNNWKEKE